MLYTDKVKGTFRTESGKFLCLDGNHLCRHFGRMGESITSYSFGMQRKSYTMTLSGLAAGTYSAYAYNGEYTHQSIGLQYLRARYLDMETGIFISRDSYAGKVWDILSQNRYTYAENNPVTFVDPSGHVKAIKGVGSVIGSKVTGGLSNLKTSFVSAVNKKSTNNRIYGR